MPASRASMASGYNSADGRIYLVGGYSGDEPSSAQTTAWAYNPATNTFSTLAPIPHPVGGAASGVVNGELVVAGGRDAAGEMVDLVWDYSFATNTWTARADLPSPTNAAGSAVASGKLWTSEARLRRAPARRPSAYDPAPKLDKRPEPERRPPADGGAAIGNTLVAAGGDTGSTSTASDRGAGCGNPLRARIPTRLQRELRRRDAARATGRLDGDERRGRRRCG